MEAHVQHKESGFTLVELAVVLVIIGLIAAGILSGRAIIEASETRAVMAETRKHLQSFAMFMDRYRAYPGDFANADTAFNIASSFNGNGNNRIVWQSEAEGTRAWYHLQMAGLADGVYTGSGTTGTPGVTVPLSNIGGGGIGYFVDYDSGDLQNHLGIGFSTSGAGINDNPALSPLRAEAIDRKLDDSKPGTGFVQSTGTDCVDSGEYKLSDEDEREALSCVLRVRIDE